MVIVWEAVGASILPNIGGWVSSPMTIKAVKNWYKVSKQILTLTPRIFINLKENRAKLKSNFQGKGQTIFNISDTNISVLIMMM